MSLFASIKELVSCKEVASFYGIKIVRRMASCPFHTDKHPSMLIDDTHYHCFSCAAHGDAINLVATMYNISNWQAALKINEDMSLNIAVSRTASHANQRINKRELSQYQQNKLFEKWVAEAIDTLTKADKAINHIIDNRLKNTSKEDLVATDHFWRLINDRERIQYYIEILYGDDNHAKVELFRTKREAVKRYGKYTIK